MNQIINMILRQITRRVVNAGINAGMRKASAIRKPANRRKTGETGAD